MRLLAGLAVVFTLTAFFVLPGMLSGLYLRFHPGLLAELGPVAAGKTLLAKFSLPGVLALPGGFIAAFALVVDFGK